MQNSTHARDNGIRQHYNALVTPQSASKLSKLAYDPPVIQTTHRLSVTLFVQKTSVKCVDDIEREREKWRRGQSPPIRAL